MTPPRSHMWLLLLPALLVSPPAAAAGGGLARIAGTVGYVERVALPADATLALELLAVAPADAVAPDARPALLARLALPTGGRQVPLAFELPFHRADLRPGLRFELRATLLSGGERLFAGTRALAAPGAAGPVALTLTRATPAAPAPARVEDAYWKLLELDGQPARRAADERPPYLLLLDGRVSGGSGCNKLMGRYTLAGAALRFDALARTRAACAPALMAQETAFLDMLDRVRGYRIRGTALELVAGERTLARFILQTSNQGRAAE